jgi:hypothetical protein
MNLNAPADKTDCSEPRQPSTQCHSTPKLRGHTAGSTLQWSARAGNSGGGSPIC